MLFANRRSNEYKLRRIKSLGYLNDSQGDNESIWALPDSFPCFSLIIIRDSPARLVAELPPLAIFAGREAGDNRNSER